MSFIFYSSTINLKIILEIFKIRLLEVLTDDMFWDGLVIPYKYSLLCPPYHTMPYRFVL